MGAEEQMVAQLTQGLMRVSDQNKRTLGRLREARRGIRSCFQAVRDEAGSGEGTGTDSPEFGV